VISSRIGRLGYELRAYLPAGIPSAGMTSGVIIIGGSLFLAVLIALPLSFTPPFPWRGYPARIYTRWLGTCIAIFIGLGLVIPWRAAWASAYLIWAGGAALWWARTGERTRRRIFGGLACTILAGAATMVLSIANIRGWLPRSIGWPMSLASAVALGASGLVVARS
jgi:hypothetical protein